MHGATPDISCSAKRDARGRVDPASSRVTLDADSHTAILIDYLTATGPMDAFGPIYDLLRTQFGEPDPNARMMFYNSAWKFTPAVHLGSGHVGGQSTCRVELKGSGLAELYADDSSVFTDPAIAFISELVGLGFVATRIDVAIDYHGERNPLILQLHDACVEGALCGMRSFDYREPCDQSGVPTGRTLYIGKSAGRGGGGRFVRCYDKGMEQDEKAQPGQWVRWEVQFEKDCAAQVARGLAYADDWKQYARDVALGACDFRQGTDKNIDRRQRLPFWQAILQGTDPQRVTVHREDTDLDGFKAWARKVFGPTIQAVHEKGDIPIHLLIADIMDGVETTPNTFKRPAVDQWIKQFKGESK